MSVSLRRRFRTSGSSQPAAAAPRGSELVAERDRLTERFAVMQSELGGLFYEMAIRDHVKLDVLIEKAAALQHVDLELGQVERLLETGETNAGGRCPQCGAIHARGAAYCSNCASPVSG
jgi:hypothetical protein